MPELFTTRLDDALLVHGLAARTRLTYTGCAARLVDWAGRDPAALDRGDLERFLAHLVRDRGISPATHALYVAALRFVYEKALRLPEVTRGLPRPRVEPPIPEILSTVDVARVLAAATSSKARATLALGYFAGLRVSEVTHLGAEAVDATRQVVVVQRAKGGRFRLVVLPQRAVGLVAEYLAEATHGSRWLFPGRRPGAPVSERTLNRYLRAALDRSGVSRPGITFHSLRHSYATHLLDRGVSIRVIQVLLGHRRLDTTTRYAQVSARQFDAVRASLESLASATSNEFGHHVPSGEAILSMQEP